jgi:hypothetical protein
VTGSGNRIIVDGDFEGEQTRFATKWEPHSTYGPTNNGVSQAVGLDTSHAGLWFAFVGDGQPVTNYIDQSFTTTANEFYAFSFWVAIQPDQVTDGDVFDSPQYAPQLDLGWSGGGFNNLVFSADGTYNQAYTQYTFD